jgi:hypothetical protein
MNAFLGRVLLWASLLLARWARALIPRSTEFPPQEEDLMLPSPSIWVLRGQARPSVRLPDLGLTLLYGQEVGVLEERARISRDLSLALTARTVARVVHSLSDHLQAQVPAPPSAAPPASHNRPPEAAPPAAPAQPPRQAQPAQPPAQPPSHSGVQPPSHSGVQPPSHSGVQPPAQAEPPEWAGALAAQNAQILELLSRQPVQAPAQAPVHYRPAAPAERDEPAFREEVPIYIPTFEPKQIQGDVSQAITADLTGGESLAESAALLSQIRGSGSRKRRRPASAESDPSPEGE